MRKLVLIMLAAGVILLSAACSNQSGLLVTETGPQKNDKENESELTKAADVEINDIEECIEQCQQVVESAVGNVEYVGLTSGDYYVCGKNVTGLIFTDGSYNYTTVPDYGYITKIDNLSDASVYKKDTAEELMGKILGVRHSLFYFVKDNNYYNIQEENDGVPTGTYATFIFDGMGKIQSASFYRSENEDVSRNELIDEREAFEAAVAVINDEYEDFEIDQTYEDTEMELQSILDRLYYVIVIYAYPEGKEHTQENAYRLVPEIDAQTGECAMILK